jgi:hypothetical protein
MRTAPDRTADIQTAGTAKQSLHGRKYAAAYSADGLLIRDEMHLMAARANFNAEFGAHHAAVPYVG